MPIRFVSRFGPEPPHNKTVVLTHFCLLEGLHWYDFGRNFGETYNLSPIMSFWVHQRTTFVLGCSNLGSYLDVLFLGLVQKSLTKKNGGHPLSGPEAGELLA